MAERYDCAECKESLYGQKYILKDESMYCIKCYEALFSNTCEVCHLLIASTSKVNRSHQYSHYFPPDRHVKRPLL